MFALLLIRRLWLLRDERLCWVIASAFSELLFICQRSFFLRMQTIYASKIAAGLPAGKVYSCLLVSGKLTELLLRLLSPLSFLVCGIIGDVSEGSVQWVKDKVAAATASAVYSFLMLAWLYCLKKQKLGHIVAQREGCTSPKHRAGAKSYCSCMHWRLIHWLRPTFLSRVPPLAKFQSLALARM